MKPATIARSALAAPPAAASSQGPTLFANCGQMSVRDDIRHWTGIDSTTASTFGAISLGFPDQQVLFDAETFQPSLG